MNEQLQAAVTELINRSLVGIDKAVDFLNAEMPDVVRQLMAWHFTVSLVQFLAGATGLVFIWVGFKVFLVKTKGKNTIDDLVFVTTIPSGLSILPVVLMFTSLDWLKITIAPKIWLIEYAASLAK
jgi:hypothetical protein